MDHAEAAPTSSQFASLPGTPHRKLQGLSGSGPGWSAERRSRLPILLAFGIAAVALALWGLTTDSEAAALLRLPPTQRAVLYQRTLGNLSDLCQGVDRPRSYCREQATLLLQLPECTEACRAQARAELQADSAVK